MTGPSKRSQWARVKTGAIGALIAVAAVAPVPACGASDSASCDGACANALGQCGANPDMCLTTCNEWRNSIASSCVSQVDDLLRCWRKATDLDCSASTFVAPSCSTQAEAFASCSSGSSGGGDASADGTGGGSTSSSGAVVVADASGGGSSGGGSSGGGATSGGGSTSGSSSGTAGDASSSGGYSCSHLPVVFGGATSACTQCVGSNCCSEDLACGASSDCMAEISCFGSCTTGACDTSCAVSHPTGQTYNNALLLCVSAKCSTPCYGSNSNPCQNVGGWGNDCGSNIGGDPARLYLCNNGSVAGSIVCQNGCYAQAAGQPDYCIGSDPCVNNVFPSGQQAQYCGSSLSPTAAQNSLYTCNGETTVTSTACTNGCFAAPPGQADHCN